MTLHYRAEGRQSYAVLLFAPSSRPFDLFDPSRKGRVKLYVRRVYITDDAELLPSYLRFVRGVVDSEDLPLNISREMLQNNPVVTQIRKAVTSRRAGAGEVWVWRSSGSAGFEVVAASKEEAERVRRGTEVVLHFKAESKQYLEPHTIERIVRTYSDHILFPIELAGGKDGPRQINAASAIWQRPKSEIKPEDYTQA